MRISGKEYRLAQLKKYHQSLEGETEGLPDRLDEMRALLFERCKENRHRFKNPDNPEIREISNWYRLEGKRREVTYALPSIGNKLWVARRNKGMTQHQLAYIIDVDHSYISRWEKGHMMPAIDKMYRTCQALEISMDDLFNLEGK